MAVLRTQSINDNRSTVGIIERSGDDARKSYGQSRTFRNKLVIIWIIRWIPT